MTVAALLADLRLRGVDVGLEDGRLRVEGPADMLTEGLLTELKAHKGELLRHLQGPVGIRLVLVRHEHRCRCGVEFKCTTPTCVGKDIRCVCCKLDEIEQRRAETRSVR